MLQVADVVAVLEDLAPPYLAEPWDNVGLMFGSRSWPVEHLLLAVDVRRSVIAQAGNLPHTLIITHHPLFFDPIRSLTDESQTFEIVRLLAQSQTALYSAHTNLDNSPTHGTVPALARAFGFERIEPMLPAGETEAGGETSSGLGGVAILPEPMTCGDLARHVAQRLASPVVTTIGLPEAALVSRVALIPGAGGSEMHAAARAGADVAITGELKHHEMLAAAEGLGVICAGHFETERPVLGLLQQALRERLPGLDVSIADETSPIATVITPQSGGS